MFHRHLAMLNFADGLTGEQFEYKIKDAKDHGYLRESGKKAKEKG